MSGLPQQEKGMRPACALPYELEVDAALGNGRKSLVVQFAAGKAIFGERSSGAAFHVYAPGKSRDSAKGTSPFENCRTRAYAVSAGDKLTGEWPLADFENESYHLRVHGPNGFFRAFQGNSGDPGLEVRLEAVKAEKFITRLMLKNTGPSGLTVKVLDRSYGGAERSIIMGEAGTAQGVVTTALDLEASHGWYDLRIQVVGAPTFERHYAGHVENGRDSFSDPAMAG